MWIICIYLALAAIFYLVLTATARDLAVPATARHPKWQRARRFDAISLLRRIRIGMAAHVSHLPRRPR